jgi:regulatory protein
MIAEQAQQLTAAIYQILAQRDHSVMELQRKLAARGFALPAITAAINQFIDRGLVNDSVFATNFINMKQAQGYGPLCIKQELLARGISQDVIAAQLDFSATIWRPIAHKVWQKKFHGMLPNSRREQAKQLRFLQYRGFSYEHIIDIIGRYEQNN